MAYRRLIVWRGAIPSLDGGQALVTFSYKNLGKKNYFRKTTESVHKTNIVSAPIFGPARYSKLRKKFEP